MSGLGVPAADQRFERQVEARYRGQSFEIAVEAGAGESPEILADRFAEAHRAEQGYVLQGHPVDAVTLRLRAAATPSRDQGGAEIFARTEDTGRERRIHVGGQWRVATVRQREGLSVGTCLAGPAILEELTATTFVPPGWTAEVLPDGTLILAPEVTS